MKTLFLDAAAGTAAGAAAGAFADASDATTAKAVVKLEAAAKAAAAATAAATAAAEGSRGCYGRRCGSEPQLRGGRWRGAGAAVPGPPWLARLKCWHGDAQQPRSSTHVSR